MQAVTDYLQQNKEWSRAVIFDHEGAVLFSTFKSNDEEIKALVNLFEDRQATVGSGIVIDGSHYDVHRFHPPLVYGRRGDSAAGEGEGIAVCTVQRKSTGTPVFALITYGFPTLSARAAPMLLEFCENLLVAV